MSDDFPTLSDIGEQNIRSRYGTLNTRLGRMKGRLFNVIGTVEEIQIAIRKEAEKDGNS